MFFAHACICNGASPWSSMEHTKINFSSIFRSFLVPQSHKTQANRAISRELRTILLSPRGVLMNFNSANLNFDSSKGIPAHCRSLVASPPIIKISTIRCSRSLRHFRPFLTKLRSNCTRTRVCARTPSKLLAYFPK